MKRGHVTGLRRERTGASDWYQQIEAEHLARIEAAWAAQEEAAYLAPLLAAEEREQATGEEGDAYDDGDLVPWDRAA